MLIEPLLNILTVFAGALTSSSVISIIKIISKKRKTQKNREQLRHEKMKKMIDEMEKMIKEMEKIEKIEKEAEIFNVDEKIAKDLDYQQVKLLLEDLNKKYKN